MNFMHLHINIHNYMKYSKAALLYSKESLNKRNETDYGAEENKNTNVLKRQFIAYKYLATYLVVFAKWFTTARPV